MHACQPGVLTANGEESDRSGDSQLYNTKNSLVEEYKSELEKVAATVKSWRLIEECLEDNPAHKALRYFSFFTLQGNKVYSFVY